jgi:hypothetical protein
MLAPELIETPTGTHVDARALGDDEDVDAMFEDSARAFVHYALLGELCGVEVLCLGAESRMISRTLPIAWSNLLRALSAMISNNP